jgi:ABC-type multidrug transport system fused ATPase/permease subunit
LIRRLLGLAWHYRGGCASVLSLQIALLSLGLAGLSLTGLGIDVIRYRIAGGAPPSGRLAAFFSVDGAAPALEALAGAILCFALLRALLNYRYQVALNILLQQRLVVDLRATVYSRLQQLSFRFFDANSTGSIITRVTGDVQSVRMFLDQVLFQGVIMVLSLGVYTAYMAVLHPGLTLACLAPMPLLAVASLWFSHVIQPRYAINRHLVDRMVQTLAESVQGIAVTKGFGREAEDRARFEAANRACLEQQRGIFWRLSLFSPAVGFCSRLSLVVLLAYGGWLVAQDQLPLGAGLIVFAGLLEQFSGQVNNLTTIINSAQQSLIGARRIFEILEAPIEVRSSPTARPCPRLAGRITFDHVGFAYDGIDPILRDIDLDVPAGHRVAILGATGAGKSVLMSLIPRFYDVTAGRLLVDGQDVRELVLADLRRNIGMVFQESFLFSHTVAANIAFGYPEASRAQIERAARSAAAHDFITALPQGYDTVLGESGNTLSGGQRQRLALARALLLEPAILLLDDPTAALDSQTEQEIFTALDQAMAGRTTFIVAHRVSTLRRADLIIVMDNGRIVQRGTHAELLAIDGPYRHVAQLQLVDARHLSSPFDQAGGTV